MYRYAVVNEKNEVENVIVWDGVAPWKPPVGCFVVRSDYCDVGQIYDSKTQSFSYPPVPIQGE